ncbi:glutathione S-transferase family protein [Enhygromyxa salina]|uniref:glutathione S-transferase family protein n=1 Tax=Enhygromyxa salina TaxID=215803 RepID=UPI0011B2633E|nr:glutathione S-transferase family protein [Enhygromyxa salina]
MSPAKATVKGGEVLQLPGAAERSSPEQGAAERPTLYHFPTSLPSQQVRLVLAEKGVEWHGTTVNIGPAHENLEPWYARLNSRMVVPTLEVEGRILTDVVEIVTHVDEHFDGPSLIPEDPDERAEVLHWVEVQAHFPMRELGYARTKGMVRWFQRWSLRQQRGRLRRLIRKNPGLRKVYEARRRELDALDRGIRHRVAMQELVDEVDVLLDEIEATLEEREWLAGPRYTLADAMWTAVLSKLEQIGFARSLSSHRRPQIAQWYARLRERPSWHAMIRRLSAWQALRFYGPAVAKTFLVFWVLKWMIVIGLGWLVAHLRG